MSKKEPDEKKKTPLEELVDILLQGYPEGGLIGKAWDKITKPSDTLKEASDDLKNTPEEPEKPEDEQKKEEAPEQEQVEALNQKSDADVKPDTDIKPEDAPTPPSVAP